MKLIFKTVLLMIDVGEKTFLKLLFKFCCHCRSKSQRVQWKKKLGLRDESIYRDGAAGDGANQRHKRQG